MHSDRDEVTQSAYDAHIGDTDTPRNGRYGWVIALSLIAALWLATIETYRPDAPNGTNSLSFEFSALRAGATLQNLVGDSIPHPIGTASNAAVRDRIVRELRDLGYNPELQAGVFVCNLYAACGMPVNIIVRIEGSKDTRNAFGANDNAASAVLLVAHYDSVPAGPGASDDGAGVASVLEIAGILRREHQPLHSIILLLDEGEEAGLLGAQLFVQHHRWSHNVKAAINLEARGTSGASLMFETGSANAWLMGRYAGAVPRPLTNSIWYSLYRHMSNGTDFSVFKAAGDQGFNFAFIGDVANYHTPQDDVGHVDLRSIQQQGEQALAMLLSLANSDIDHATVGEAEFFDLFGRILVRIPQKSMLPAALSTLILVLVSTAWLVRQGGVSLRELAWGLLGVALSLLVAGGGGALLLLSARAIASAGIPPFVAFHWIFLGTFTALAAFVNGAVSASLRGRVKFWGLWCANAIWNAVLAVLIAAALPGGTYLPLLPAIVGLLALVVRGRGGLRQSIGRELAALAYFLVMFTLLWPIVIQLYAALGTVSLPLLTMLLVFGTCPLAGLIFEAGIKARRSYHCATAVLAILGLGLSVSMPVYSEKSPQRFNVMYQIDGERAVDGTVAHWLTQSDGRRFPRGFQEVVRFEPRSQPLHAWDDNNGLNTFVADAPLVDLPQPRLTVKSTTMSSDLQGVHYKMKVASNRAAPVMVVAFSPSARIHSVSVAPVESNAGMAAAVRLSPQSHQWSVLRLVGLPPEGAMLSFDAADEDFDVALVDRSYGLPPFPLAQALERARPLDTTAAYEGDVTMVAATIHLSRPPANSQGARNNERFQFKN